MSSQVQAPGSGVSDKEKRGEEIPQATGTKMRVPNGQVISQCQYAQEERDGWDLGFSNLVGKGPIHLLTSSVQPQSALFSTVIGSGQNQAQS